MISRRVGEEQTYSRAISEDELKGAVYVIRRKKQEKSYEEKL